jgi:hypothetical protein
VFQATPSLDSSFETAILRTQTGDFMEPNHGQVAQKRFEAWYQNHFASTFAFDLLKDNSALVKGYLWTAYLQGVKDELEEERKAMQPFSGPPPRGVKSMLTEAQDG